MYAAFGVGAAGVLVGGVTGAMTLSQAGDIKDACPNDECTPEHEGDVSSARTLGTVSTVAFVVGAVGLAAGTTLLVLELGRKKDPERAGAGAAVAIGVGAVRLDGRF
jgi:hypothetical protein